MRLVDRIHRVVGALQTDINGGATTTTPVKVDNCDRVRIAIDMTSSGAATSAITVEQATTAAFGTNKAVAFTEYWRNHTVATNDLLTNVAATSNTFVAGGAAETRTYIIEIMAEDLDVTNGYHFLRVAAAQAVGGKISVSYDLYELRQKMQPQLQTAIA